MALEIQRGKSPWWYGRVMANGKYYGKNLGVEVKGKIPATLKELGDFTFEQSRMEAHAALEQFKRDLKKRSTAEELVQTIHEIRTGDRVHSLALTAMAEAWKVAPRHRAPSVRYLAQGISMIERFVAFLKSHYPVVREMADVQTKMARDFLKGEADRGVAPKTYNGTLVLLRSCFKMLRKEAGLAQNPFEDLLTQAEEIVFRKPFTEEELAAIIEAGKDDDFIRPIIVTAVSTAMRKGDCCLLKWESIDLKSSFIAVKTSKTKVSVSIPIFPMLQEALWKAGPKKTGYVFPEQAEMYKENPDGITWRVRQIFRKAGFFDEGEAEEGEACRGTVREKRAQGLRLASVRDFHSFRVTWVTLALSAGIPLEVVQKVTGHRTTHIVLKHYFQPGREEFRRVLAEKLPKLITGAPEVRLLGVTELRAGMRTMTAETWERIRDDLMARSADDKEEPGRMSRPA